MTKHSHPELDGQNPQTLYTFQLKRPGQALRERLAWGAFGLSIGLSVAAGYLFLNPSERAWSWPLERSNAAAVADPFRQGAEQAMSAAQLTQTAEFREEWVEVAMLWQQAIAHMRSVPKSSPQFELAQQKIGEYTRNLQYAESNVASRAARVPTGQVYWTVGSDRDLVLALQGPPAQVIQQSSTCQQTLRYGNSMVELNNGYVEQYNNPDGMLKVLAEGPVAFSAQAAQSTWTLGSTEADVMRLQGTPTRQEQYTSDRFKTLYYGRSSVFFENGQAIGYLNDGDNLKVSVQLPALPAGQTAPESWSMGSSRTEVLRAENHTPVAISRNDANCEEIFHFKGGEVTFHQGLVAGYRDSQRLAQGGDRGNALKVK